MKEYRYGHFRFLALENEIYPGTEESRFLFNRKLYLQIHTITAFSQFVILNEKLNILEGTIIFERNENSAVSLRRATFGSLELRTKINYDILYEFFSFIRDYFRDTTAKTILIRHYPDFYDPLNGPVIALTLSHAGFRVTVHDINHHLPVNENIFSAGINKMERRKLKKCIDTGLKVKSGAIQEIIELYREMTNFRNKAKIPSSIGDRELADSFKHFPDNYSLHYVTNDRDDILAGAILVKITNTILYYFSPATNPAYSKISPMVFLLDSLYGFAKENGCQALDLGISSIGNRPQKGLIRFKDHIGGITSSRFTFQLDL